MFNDRPFAETISLLAGRFSGIECSPAKTRSLHGMPYGDGGIERDPDAWRNALAGSDLAELNELLSAFSLVTVHLATPGKYSRMGSPDASEREETWDRCSAAMRFAAAIGAPLVTFHQAPTPASYEEWLECRRHFVEFGRRAADMAGELGLTVGFEKFDNELIDDIGAKNFGILFDIGHAAKTAPGPDECTDHTLDMLREAGERVIEFHVHGVRWDGERFLDHVPFALNDCLDYRRIVRFAQERRMNVPWVFEIQLGDPSIDRSHGSEDLVAAFEEARDFLVRCWDES